MTQHTHFTVLLASTTNKVSKHSREGKSERKYGKLFLETRVSNVNTTNIEMKKKLGCLGNIA